MTRAAAGRLREEWMNWKSKVSVRTELDIEKWNVESKKPEKEERDRKQEKRDLKKIEPEKEIDEFRTEEK